MRFQMTEQNWQKTFKGLVIASTGGAALAGLDYIGALQLDNELLAILVSTLVPTLTNMVREWLKQ